MTIMNKNSSNYRRLPAYVGEWRQDELRTNVRKCGTDSKDHRKEREEHYDDVPEGHPLNLHGHPCLPGIHELQWYETLFKLPLS